MCLVCGKQIIGRFEGFEETSQRQFLDEKWERAGDWAVCNKHESQLAHIIQHMLDYGYNPEVNPVLSGELEYIEGKAYEESLGRKPSKYASEYAAFQLPKEAAKQRKKAIDLIDELPQKLQRIARWLVKETDGVYAEAFMAGTVTPFSYTVNGAYELLWCLIHSLRYFQ